MFSIAVPATVGQVFGMRRSDSAPAVMIRWRLYLLSAPALVLVGVFCYLPALSGLYFSFFDWTGAEPIRFVGLENYREVLSDRVLLSAFGTVALLVIFNIFKILPAILLAVAIHRLRNNRWRSLYEMAVVIPMLAPEVVSIYLWKYFFDPTIGPINRFLEATGLKSLLVTLDARLGSGNTFIADVPINWFSSPELVLPSLFLWGFPWVSTIGVLLHLNGLRSIDRSVYDAAAMDGAGSMALFRHIELPLILTQVRINVVLTTINTLQGFGLLLLLFGESGGPNAVGMVPGLWMYNRAFYAGEFGYACAVGMVLFAAIAGLTWIIHCWIRIVK